MAAPDAWDGGYDSPHANVANHFQISYYRVNAKDWAQWQKDISVNLREMFERYGTFGYRWLENTAQQQNTYSGQPIQIYLNEGTIWGMATSPQGYASGYRYGEHWRETIICRPQDRITAFAADSFQGGLHADFGELIVPTLEYWVLVGWKMYETQVE